MLPWGQCQVSQAAPWSEPELAQFSHAVDLDFLVFGQDLGCMPHLPWETCFCSDWHVAARCPGLWTLSWLYSSHWGWHVPCQHPHHLRPCCHRGRKSSWKADRNLGKERWSSQRKAGRRKRSSECGRVASALLGII